MAAFDGNDMSLSGDEEDSFQEEEYDYDSETEEDEDSPPTLERAYSEELFVVPEGSCTFVNYKEMYPNLLKLINSTSSILGVSASEAELLLQEFKWSQEDLMSNYFQSPQDMLIKAHIKLAQVSPLEGEDMCFICMDDFSERNGSVYSMSCNHRFHRSCYAEYIESAVSDGPSCVQLTCPMYKCTLRIPSTTVKELCYYVAPRGIDEISLPTMDRTASGCLVPLGSKTYESFSKHLIRNFIEQSSYMRWCPAPGCVYISIGRGIEQVQCPCSCLYCVKCQSPAHYPAPCELMSNWEIKNQSESENANWMLVNTKPCPKCNRRIEKNQGCNHMTCSMCRHDFCWVCLGDWSTHNGSYYNCNKFKKQDNSDLEAVKVELERYLHNFTRFQNHKKGLSIAIMKHRQLLAGEFQTCKNAFATANANCTREAFEQVIDCRRMLQHSYVLGYYALNDTPEHQLFEFQQQMLESNTEALNHLTEKFESENLTEDEYDHLKNLTGVTKKFISQMMCVDDMPMKAT